MSKIKIYNPTTGSNEYVCENAKVKKTLNKTDVVTCTIKSESKLTFLIGSYIDSATTSDGNYTRYKINKQPIEKKISSTLFDYDVVFESPMYDLKKSTFQILGKTDTSYIGDAESYIDLIISSLATDGYTFTKGSIDSTDDKSLQFTGENCWAVLNRICTDFNLEFQFVGNEISLAYRIINDRTLIALSQGFGNGIVTINKVESQENNIITRLYYEGSTKNLPSGYGNKRLQGTTPYVSNNESTYGVFSAVKYYDDIFPTYTGTVGTVAYINNDKTPTFIDAATPFDLNDNLISGVLPQISMIDGDCAGYVFEFYFNRDANRFTLKPQTDAAGNQIPDLDGLDIAPGNTFKILNINFPSTYVTAAIADLDAAASAEIIEISDPPIDFDIELDAKIINDLYDIAIGNEYVFDVGDQLNITDSDLTIPTDQRITDIEYDLFYKANCSIIISETRFDLAGRKEEIDQYLNTKSAYVNSLYDPTQLQKTFRTSDDVWKQAFSSEDAKFDVDYRARKESFDPVMLALDSGEMQFNTSAKITKPSSGTIDISAGTFTIRNYNALSRHDIDNLIELSTAYEPNQEWTISGNSASYTPGTFTYLYVKVDNTKDVDGVLTGTMAELVSNIAIINNKYETTDYLYYLVGQVDENENLNLIYSTGYWNERTENEDYYLSTKYATIKGLSVHTDQIGLQIESDLDVVNDWKIVGTLSGSTLSNLHIDYTGSTLFGLTVTGIASSAADAVSSGDLVRYGQLTDYALITGLTSGYVPYFNGTNLANSNIYYNGANVGIGTTAPGAKLDINQDASAIGLLVKGGNTGSVLGRFQRDIGSVGTIDIFSNGGNAQISFTDEVDATWSLGAMQTGNSFRIANNSSIGTNDVFTILPITGNVGIGTVSPTGKLHVVGSGGSTKVESTGYILDLNRDNATSSIYNSDNFGTLSLGAGGVTDRMFIKWDGNVGIGYSTGTEIDTYKFSVNGTAYYNGTVTHASAGGVGTRSALLSDVTSLPVSTFTNDSGYLTSFTETDPIYTASTWFSTTNNSSNWNTAYTNRITSLTTTGSSGAATLIANVLNIPNYTLSGLGYSVPTLQQVTDQGNTTTNRLITTNTTDATSTTNGALYSAGGLSVAKSGYFGSTIQATTAKLTNLTDGYVPYHVSDSSGLANSPMYTNGTYIGIGTMAPDVTLNVVGNADIASVSRILRVVDKGASDTASGGILQVGLDDGAAVGDGHRLGSFAFIGVEDAASSFKTGAKIDAFADVAWSDTENGTSLAFFTNNGDNSLAEHVRITSTGNVGIGYSTGTEIDTYKFSVNGTAYYNGTVTHASAGGVGTRSALLSDVTSLPVSTFTNDSGYLTSFTETDPIYTASTWFSTTNNSSNWNTAYTNRITSLTTTGSSGAATLITNVLNIPNYSLAGLGYTVPTLDALSNTTITSVAANDLISWSGSAWINQTIDSLDIQKSSVAAITFAGFSWVTNNFAGITHTHDVVDINTTGGSEGQFLSIVSGVSAWATISAGATTLAALTDTTITGVGTGELLSWSGSTWINKTIGELDLMLSSTASTTFAAISHSHPVTDITAVGGSEGQFISIVSGVPAWVTAGSSLWTADAYGIHYSSNVGIGANSVAGYDLYVANGIQSGTDLVVATNVWAGTSFMLNGGVSSWTYTNGINIGAGVLAIANNAIIDSSGNVHSQNACADATYLNPTSITTVGGIITSIV